MLPWPNRRSLRGTRPGLSRPGWRIARLPALSRPWCQVRTCPHRPFRGSDRNSAVPGCAVATLPRDRNRPVRARYLETTMAESGTSALSAQLVITPTGILSPGVVLVGGGLIREVRPLGDESEAPAFEVLAPGFCDLQVNGIGAIDVAVAAGDDWDELGEALLAQGVTTWCPTLVAAPETETISACERIAVAMKKIRPGHPEIAGVHLEGPFITVAGAHRAE